MRGSMWEKNRQREEELRNKRKKNCVSASHFEYNKNKPWIAFAKTRKFQMLLDCNESLCLLERGGSLIGKGGLPSMDWIDGCGAYNINCTEDLGGCVNLGRR
ncbi:hypothetical protein LguiA_012598 [Lonicera macranthoides]